METEMVLQDNPIDGSRAILAVNESGEWVLRVEFEGSSHDYHPWDRVPNWTFPWLSEPPIEYETGSAPRAYFIVGDWVSEPERTSEERQAARLFMERWREGPSRLE